MAYCFAFEDFYPLQSILEKRFFLKKGRFCTHLFASSELELELLDDVSGEICYVISNVKAHDATFFKLLLLCSTLKKEKALTLILISPFLYYTRQDKPKALRSDGLNLICSLLKTAGVDEILTCDLHCEQVIDRLDLSIRSVCPQPLFYQILQQINFEPDTLVSPDRSSLKRIERLKEYFPYQLNLCFLTKIRDKNVVSHTTLSGNFGKKLLIIDDMIDTGGTLYSCLEKLEKEHVDEIVIMTSHGVFSQSPKKLTHHPLVKKLIYLDTLPQQAVFSEDKMLQVSHAPLYDAILENI